MSEIAVRRRTQIAELEKQITSPSRLEILKALLGPEKSHRFVKGVTLAVTRNPYLLECDRTSLIQSAFEAAECGLDCSGGTKGEGAMVPFGKQVQFVPMYQGLVRLLYETGLVRVVRADCICEKDEWDILEGSSPSITHRKSWNDRGEPILFYAIAELTTGAMHFVVLDRKEVEGIRDRSSGWRAYKAGKVRDSAWSTDFAEMGKKSAIRRLRKLLPISSDRLDRLDKALEAWDRDFELGRGGGEPDAPAPRGRIDLRRRPEPEPEPVTVDEAESEPESPPEGDSPGNPAYEALQDAALEYGKAKDMPPREVFSAIFPMKLGSKSVNPPDWTYFEDRPELAAQVADWLREEAANV